MRRLAIIVICLLALFTIINAYTREPGTTKQAGQTAVIGADQDALLK